MTPGELAFTAFIESLGITAEWAEVPADRQAIWEYATEEWIRANVRRSGFSEKLTSEMSKLVDGLYEKMPVSPLRQSREFLLEQLKTVTAQYHNEHQTVENMRTAFQEWSNEHPKDTETEVNGKWIAKQAWGMSVHLPSGQIIEFDEFDNRWWAWTQIPNPEFKERKRLVAIKTRGDFRRLLKCLGVEELDEDRDQYYYD